MRFIIFALIFSSLAGCSTIPAPPPFTPKEILGVQVVPRDRLSHNHRDTATPFVNRELILIGSQQDGLHALNRNNGSELWTFKVKGGVESDPVVAGEYIYFGGNDGKFYSLTLTGSKVWDYEFSSQIWSRPTIFAGIVYVAVANDQLFALDAKTGKFLWHFKSPLAGRDVTIRGVSSPVVSDQFVYAGFSDGFIYAINRHDGGLIWQQQLSRKIKFKDVDATPVIEGNDLYISSYDGRLYSLSKSSGAIKWSFDFGGIHPVVIAGNSLYHTTTSGEVFAINRKTGISKWTFKIPTGAATSPAIVGKIVVAGGSDGNLYGLDRESGEEVWRLDTSNGFSGRIATYEDTIFVQTEMGFLYAIKPELSDLRVARYHGGITGLQSKKTLGKVPLPASK